MKLEPMSVDEIKEQTAYWWSDMPSMKLDEETYRWFFLRYILAWAYERATYWETINECSLHNALNEVLDEIDWPKDKRD